ncbi:hypothetical protein HMN09_01064800 [Mycena chlorophos]|uniref:Uncharacterized protein n=1 Tax=Mycena chlorophos TaxID=658473 RepID=A0A8H6SEX2_MYCCL|nr:hypothetical protein HMN09_01064800 [Mycena chlorophos]
MSAIPQTMKAIRWHPPAFDIRVEELDVPKYDPQASGCLEPDDAIVKVSLAALCGSDLHIYRGHGGVDKTHICGHEFLGEVVELGSSFGAASAKGRPELYASLKVGDKVVSPFTVNCGECNVCRLGYTCRCPVGALFGSPALAGGQAQYVRVPKAGGTLFNLSDPSSWHSSLSHETKLNALKNINDSSLLMLADILPTGVFAALQAVNHPKVAPALTGRAYPASFFPDGQSGGVSAMTTEDRTLTFAIVGLGPVGLCACVSLLDMLSAQPLPFQMVAIDPHKDRQNKATAIYNKIDASGKGSGKFVALGIDEAKEQVKNWTGGVGATAVLEIVGNPSAITLAYELVRPFGAIVSVGVHGEPQMPFTGRQLYNKNVSFDFGRCPARAMFPMAFELLVKRQDVFGGVGGLDDLVDRIVGPDEAPEMYKQFEQNKFLEANMTLKPVVHEIRIQNQVIFLDPPIEYARANWIRQLHDWLGVVCRLRRIQSSRYEIGLQMQGAGVTETNYTALLMQLPEAVLQRPFSLIEAKVQQVTEYVGKWLQFQSLWDLEAEYVFNRLGDSLQNWQQLLTEIKKTRSTFDTSETQKTFGVCVVDYEQVQAKVNAKYDAWQRDILSRFGVKLGNAMKEMHAAILKARNDLEHHSIEGLTAGRRM